MNGGRLPRNILIGMVLGVVAGLLIRSMAPDPAAAGRYFAVVTTLFMRLIQMVIAPLVLATLIGGMAHLSDVASLGRIAMRTLVWFVLAAVVSLIIGVTAANFFNPGAHLGAAASTIGSPAIESGKAGLDQFILHLVPRSIVEAMATNEILQIVLFAVLAGIALIRLGHRGHMIIELAEQVTALMLAVTGYIMKTVPFAVFAAIAGSVATLGTEALLSYVRMIAGYYMAMALLWGFLIGGAALMLRQRTLGLLGAARAPVLIAFSTCSSEAAYPSLLEQLSRFGVSRRIAGFVLPLGYSFNLDGAMMYCAFATLTIAQAYGIALPVGEQVLLCFMLFVASKGIAGVPRASLLVVTGILPHFGIPENGILVILAVDHFLDMGRTATNVLGNSIAATAVAKWEGELSSAGAFPPVPAQPDHEASHG